MDSNFLNPIWRWIWGWIKLSPSIGSRNHASVLDKKGSSKFEVCNWSLRSVPRELGDFGEVPFIFNFASLCGYSLHQVSLKRKYSTPYLTLIGAKKQFDQGAKDSKFQGEAPLIVTEP